MEKITSYITFSLFLGLFIFGAVVVESGHAGLAIRIFNKAFWVLVILVLIVKVNYAKK